MDVHADHKIAAIALVAASLWPAAAYAAQPQRRPGQDCVRPALVNVKFQKSLVRMPFRILTKDEEKLLSRNDNDIRWQVQDAFKKKN